MNTHGYKGEINLQKTVYVFQWAPVASSSISTKEEEIQLKEKKKKQQTLLWIYQIFF